MKRKITIIISLAPALLAAAFAVTPSAASAAACRVLIAGVASPGVEGVGCSNPPGVTAPQNLRDDADGTAPLSTKFGTDGLAVNTKGPLRFRATDNGVVVPNENPAGYAFFGLKLDKNELSSATVCRKVTGWVTSADIQNATPSAVFSGTAPTPSGLGPWTLTLNSDSNACPAAERGKVTIANVSLLFETLVPITKTPVKATGSFTGKYEQPGANCANGGVKLDISQLGITTEPATTNQEVDNGAGGAAFVCFVSANNYVFPSTPATWAASTNQIWKD